MSPEARGGKVSASGFRRSRSSASTLSPVSSSRKNRCWLNFVCTKPAAGQLNLTYPMDLLGGTGHFGECFIQTGLAALHLCLYPFR